MHTNQINCFHIVINLGYNKLYNFGTNMQSKAQCVKSSAFPIGFLIEILQKCFKNSLAISQKSRFQQNSDRK